MDPSLGMQQAAKGWKVGYGPKSYDKKLGKMWKTTGKKKKGRWLWAQVLRQEVGKNVCLQ